MKYWRTGAFEVRTFQEDEGKTFGQKRTSLQQLPTESEELFARILEALSIDERRDTLRLLKWIALASRRLMPSKVCFALALESPDPSLSLEMWKHSEEYIRDEAQMAKMVRNRSRGLVEIKHVAFAYSSHKNSAALLRGSTSDSKYPIQHTSPRISPNIATDDDGSEERYEDDVPSDDATATVQFIHESLAEFLFRRGFRMLDQLSDKNVIGRCHNELAMSCLRYLDNVELRHQVIAPTDTQSLASASNQSTAISMSSSDTSDPHLDAELPLEDQRERKYGKQDSRTRFPFLEYSATALLYHSQRAEALNVSQEYLAYGLSGYCS